jgi:hypothetical protein
MKKIIFFFISLLFLSRATAFDSTTNYASAYTEIMMEHSIYQGMSEESNLGTNILVATFINITPLMPGVHTVMTNYVGPEVRRRINNRIFKKQAENVILTLRATKKNVDEMLNNPEKIVTESSGIYQVMDKLVVALKNRTQVIDHYNLPYPYHRSMRFRMQSDHNDHINGIQEILILNREFFVRGMIHQAIGKEIPENTTEKLMALSSYCQALELLLAPYSGKTEFEKKYFMLNDLDEAIRGFSEARAIIRNYLEGNDVEESTLSSMLITASRIHDPMKLSGENEFATLFTQDEYADEKLLKKIDLSSLKLDLSEVTPPGPKFMNHLDEFEYKNRHHIGGVTFSMNSSGSNPYEQITNFLSANLFSQKEGTYKYYLEKIKNFHYQLPEEKIQIYKLALLCDQMLAELYKLKNNPETK